MSTTRRHRSDDPGLDPRVAAVLAAAAAPTEPGPQPGEAAALAAFRAAAPAPTRRIRMLPSLKATVVATAAVGALLTGGVAAAATGTLPGAASSTARTVLGAVGVSVPGSDTAATHSATRGKSLEAKADHGTETPEATEPSAAAAAPATTATPNHGQQVSELARTTTLTGRDKGAAISTFASGGKARAHQHAKSTPAPAATETATPDVNQSRDGQSTAATSSDGHSTEGTSHRP